jgi:hypothetical protein
LQPQSITFRSPTLALGAVNTRSFVAPVAAVIPNGATGGTTNGIAARLIIGALDVGDGTVEVCWLNWTGAGKFVLDEDELITTANAAMNAADTWYSTTVRANVPYRILGFVEITEAAAGVWASQPTLTQMGGAYALAVMVGLKLRGVIPFLSKSAAYTTDITDNGIVVTHPSADVTARVFTIDSEANVPYPVGTCISFRNQPGAGVLTIAVTADVLIWAPTSATGPRTLAAGGFAVAVKEAPGHWLITGVGLT